MYLSSLTFTVLILPLLLLMFCLLPQKGKYPFLLCAGLLIFGWSSPVRLVFPAAYLCFDYGIGLLLGRLQDRRGISRAILVGASLLQAAALLMIRRAFADSTDPFFPIGTAIMTLQGLGYLIGVCRKKHPAEKNFLHFALYLTFFPLLYAGPLISYPEFRSQLEKRRYNIHSLGAGIELFIRGLAEKVVFADTLGYVFRELRQTDPAQISMLTAWLTVVTFSMYLYFELLGYADMARGLGKCFGITLPKAFGQPFLSNGVTQFMEQWNITHVLWFQSNFRHLLLQGSKHRWMKYASLVVMWMLIGIWYNTTFPFLLWGMFIGLLLAVEQLFLGKILERNYAFGLAYTAVVLQFAWVFLFADSLPEVLAFWKAMLGFGSGLADSYGIYFFTSYIVFLLICFYIASDLFRNIMERIAATAVGRKIAVYMPLINCLILIFCMASMLYADGQAELWLHL